MKNIIILLLIFGIAVAQSNEVVSPSDGFGYAIKEFGRGVHLFVTDIIGDEVSQVQARLEIQRELYQEMAKEEQMGNIQEITKLEQKESKLQNEIQSRVQSVIQENNQLQLQEMNMALGNHEQIMVQQRTQSNSTMFQIRSQEQLKEMLNVSTQTQSQMGSNNGGR